MRDSNMVWPSMDEDLSNNDARMSEEMEMQEIADLFCVDMDDPLVEVIMASRGHISDRRHMLGTDCVQCIISLLDDDLSQLPQSDTDPVEIKVIGGTRKISPITLGNQFLNYPKWYVALWMLSNYHVYDDEALGRMTIDMLYVALEHEMGKRPDFSWLKEVL